MDFLQGSSARITRELLELNKSQLRWVTRLFANTVTRKGPFKIGINFQPRLRKVYERASHILCEREALAYLTFRELGHCFTY
jgi:hypothetical protein